MKQVLVLIIMCSVLFALEQQSTLKVYHRIFSDLLHKKQIKVYTDDRELLRIFQNSDTLLSVTDPNMSDIVIVNTPSAYEKIRMKLKKGKNALNKIIFATDYRLMKQYPDIVGALYWKKGRSQLIFLKLRLLRHSIVLPETYNPYILEQL